MNDHILSYFEDVTDGNVDSYDSPWEALQCYPEEIMQPKVFFCEQIVREDCSPNQPQQTEDAGYEIPVVD